MNVRFVVIIRTNINKYYIIITVTHSTFVVKEQGCKCKCSKRKRKKVEVPVILGNRP